MGTGMDKGVKGSFFFHEKKKSCCMCARFFIVSFKTKSAFGVLDNIFIAVAVKILLRMRPVPLLSSQQQYYGVKVLENVLAALIVFIA